MREFLRYIPYEDIGPQGLLRGAAIGHEESVPIISLVSVVQGEILECLEGDRRLALREILEHLRRPTHIVTMALGALIYNGLVIAAQGDKFISVWIKSNNREA